MRWCSALEQAAHFTTGRSTAEIVFSIFSCESIVKSIFLFKVQLENENAADDNANTVEPEHVNADNDEIENEVDDDEEAEDEDEIPPWQDEECKILYRVYVNVRSMLANRGYGVVETGQVADLKFLEDQQDPVESIECFYQRMKGNAEDIERSKMRIEASRGGLEDGEG